MSNEITPMEAMRGTLVKMQPEFAAALPPQIPVEKFIRTTLTPKTEKRSSTCQWLAAS
jgi:hypothetical protein